MIDRGAAAALTGGRSESESAGLGPVTVTASERRRGPTRSQNWQTCRGPGASHSDSVRDALDSESGPGARAF